MKNLFRLVLVLAVLAIVAGSFIAGVAGGALLIAFILIAILAATLDRGPGDCDCPVDHSEALLDDEQTPA